MDAFMGTILPWAGQWAPRGWSLCQGQQLAINENQALYSLLGTVYGGDGRTTFQLPDLRSRFPMGAGAGSHLTGRTLGEAAGSEAAILAALNLPTHTHAATFTAASGSFPGTLQASSQQGDSKSPQGNYLANAFVPGDTSSNVASTSLASYVTPHAAGTLETLAGLSVSGSGGGTVTVQPNIGGGQPVPVLPPFLVLNFIICVQGLYPQRS